MGKKVEKTKSAKRYTFSSFRDRVDAIKIEPSRRLNTRAFDEAESSHFISTMERWVEFNKSGTFTRFCEGINGISQSLPQIIHYKVRIFDELASAISKHDEISLQPLLELLTQFCHDLGPDFLEFYERTLKLITDLALADNTSDTLEWEFNCLAFIFKYLSRSLTQDLIPTFELLLPLFNSKEHVARFSAEALSFLLRKMTQDNLVSFTDFAFKKVGPENYNTALVLLFSESMQSTQGCIHSKSHIIIRCLLESNNSEDITSVLGDILIKIINFGSPSSVEEVYKLVVGIISERIVNDKSYVGHYVKILTVLLFADSGSKINDWKLITEALKYLTQNISINECDSNTRDLLVYLFAIFFRNCEIKTLTKFHSTLFQYALSLESHFLPLVSVIFDLSRERALKYLRPFIQEFINTKWESNHEFVACFIDELTNKGLISSGEEPSKLRILIPTSLIESISRELTEIPIQTPRDLYEVYWRTLILSHGAGVDTDLLLRVIDRVDSFENISTFKKSVLSKIIGMIALTDGRDDIIFKRFPELYTNSAFLATATSFVKKHKDAFLTEKNDLISLVSENLLSPNHRLRHETLLFIGALTVSTDEDMNLIATQADIIEEIPLTLNNGRDVGIRMRSLASQFRDMHLTNDNSSKVFFKFLFGMLSVRFSPSWKAVYEVLPSTFHKNKKLVWDLAFEFIRSSNKDSEDDFFDGFSDEIEQDVVNWSIIDPRLSSVVGNANQTIMSYLTKNQTLMDSAESRNGIGSYPEFMRAHCIEALKKIPEVAETNSSDLVALVLDGSDDDDEDEDTSLSKFTKKEKLSLLEIFALFKKLKSIPRADELYHKLLCWLSNKSPDMRKIALRCLLNYKNQHVLKYKDNLSNLLDDSLFRDEVSKITSKGEDRVIEDDDVSDVMPLVLRIIFGRAQTTTSSGSKKGMKFGSLSTLPSLSPEHISQFLKIVSEKVYDHSSENEGDWTPPLLSVSQISARTLRRNLGFSNLLSDIIPTLGEKFKNLLSITIEPLICCLLASELVIGNESIDPQILNLARSVRQSGMRDLFMLFDLLVDFDWNRHIVVLYEKVLSPRFSHFEVENLQQPSALLKILVCWSANKSYIDLLMINGLEPSRKILLLLQNKITKDEVVSTVLDFCLNIITKATKAKYDKLTRLVADCVFGSLEAILNRATDQSINKKTIDLLLNLVLHDHVNDQSRRYKLVDLATQLLEKNDLLMPKELKLQILEILKALILEFDGGFEEIQRLYEVSSRFLRFFADRQQRVILVELFEVIGSKFEGYHRVSKYLMDLNSYSKRGLGDFDYDRRLDSFRDINDVTYDSLSSLEWLPLLNCCLYFVNEVDDLAIRTNAVYTIKRFVDAISLRSTPDKKLIHIFKDLVLSNLRVGLRNKNGTVKNEYISILSHIVVNAKYMDEFKDMRVLVFHNEEEANFFTNINHIQLHRRQRAIKRLGQVAGQISGSNISHYILPMIESYAFVADESLRNIANETILTIEELLRHITYKQFLAIFKRYKSGLKEGSSTIRDSVGLTVTISRSLLKNVRGGDCSTMDGLPADEAALNLQIEREMISPIAAVLNKRDDETIVHRTPLIEALACLILCLSPEQILLTLPGVLTKICQILRSRSDELRDAVRKHLGRASRILGAKYIRFIIKELKTALNKGFQVHVLGFTVHSILSEMELTHGDLDDSASLVMDVIMENVFGSTGQEKDADGYRTTMKEVKNNKSFDIAEILSRVISISQFNDIVSPVKMLLQERITLKIENKLDEILRRISLGLYKNEDATKTEMLALSYELFGESEKEATSEFKGRVQTESEKHFLVQLNAKVQRVETENSHYVDTFQKLSLEILRSTLNKNPDFITPENLVGFLPFMEKALKSENETVVMSVLRILAMIINVEFSVDGDIFKRAARRCLEIIKNFPSTESELCQSAFKFLSVVIRHREDLSLKDTSLGYLLVRIQPDLNEQNRQSLAFNFLKALVSKHVMIPEVYDTMDKIREVMVTSHSKERRDMSRSIYFQFLMEYDQGRGRLEKQFKFLVDNLGYPAESGKQSVMELLHLIIQKSGSELLEAVSSSFFVALSKVLISETSTKSRDMAIQLITDIFKKKGTGSFEKFIRGWMNSKNSALLKCSLRLYQIKVGVSGIDKGSELHEEVLLSIKETVANSKAESATEVKWDLVYATLLCLNSIVERDLSVIDDELKSDLISCLLFPHPWIRLSASRLIGSIIKSSSDFFSDSDLQNIGYRLFHQLSAPSVVENMGEQAVKSLAPLIMHWEKNHTLFDESLRGTERDESGDEGEERSEQMMSNWSITRASAIIRSERTSVASKKAGIQLLGMVIQIFSEERVNEMAHDLILPLFTLGEIESDDDEKLELQKLALECLKLIEEKIGVSDYTSHYSRVGQFVIKRRQDRRTKRARLAVTAPEIVAKRKLKKHERTREKRKHEKDENGFYHTKKKKMHRR